MKRIQHFMVNSPVTLKQFLQNEVSLNSDHADFLIKIGAIYQNGQRVLENNQIQIGDLIRCHTEPKRFRSEISWDKHLLFENQDFVIFDKPFGLPCQASLDNRIENLLYLCSQAYKQNLLITHRLDVGTEGLIVLAKNKLFQTEFNRLLESRQVTKIYECLTTGPLLSPGRITHWMLPHPRSPKILSALRGTREIQEHWKLCELDILQSKTLNTTKLFEKNQSQGVETKSSNSVVNHYSLQLLTGRTHQIRAQLSFEKNPILGDQLYGSTHFATMTEFSTPLDSPKYEWYALKCCELKFEYQSQIFEWKTIFNPLIFKSSDFV